jgi:hypothetical protein
MKLHSKEFVYFNELSKEKTKQLKKSKRVYIDPGKRSLLYMMDDEKKYYNYTNATRVKGTKRLKYQRLMENYKKKTKKNGIISELSDYNSKTCDYELFKKYIKKKIEVNRKLHGFYAIFFFFRKIKWHLYISKDD